ncbi:ADP-ribosylation factor-binding protein GGA2-like isoform X2 [Cyanistes caeruleus]|uniref:ADP-ribosylation factor-binding protein GGA2-like isoform X2 n=1 Tax=Cyanistes caeruleus TaxID=156563 RepID=UPI000CDA7F2E|nr:ADP-ribosylation factor-binding protein GGA2-like isoform X2 [Cyanistes caeruleus]
MAGPGQLQRWLNEATDPSVSEENWECIQRFCEQVNAGTEGPLFALRLLAHKIQSPQEREALHALTVLETCVNNCGDRFHSEMAKFRFLNELIKVLSPKYYGIWSSEKVKSRVTEVIFSWTVWFPQEVKIQDAYQMLKKQGIVKEDPKLPEDKILPPPSPRPQNSIFDTDEEKSKLLARLLKSSHPEDLQAANHLIQSVVREEQEKSAQVSRRVNTISEVSETVRHVEELLENYRRHELSPAEQETLQALLQRCERLRALLFRLASEALPDEEALAEVLQASDKLSGVLGQYRQAVASQENGDGAAPAASSARAPAPRRMKSYTLIDFSELEPMAQTPPEPCADTASASQHGSTASSCLLQDECQSLGLSNSPAIQKPPPNSGLAEPAVHNGFREGVSAVQTLGPQESWEDGCAGKSEFQSLDQQLSPLSRTKTFSLDLSPKKLPFPDLPHNSVADPPLLSPGYELKPAASLHPASSDASLENLFVPLISVTPSTICPLTVYDRNGFKAMLHFCRDPAPGRPDVLVMVLSMLSTSAHPIRDIVFQAAVPKTMQIKLQPASGSELPAFNPLLPPAVVSQVLLLANPHKVLLLGTGAPLAVCVRDGDSLNNGEMQWRDRAAWAVLGRCFFCSESFPELQSEGLCGQLLQGPAQFWAMCTQSQLQALTVQVLAAGGTRGHPRHKRWVADLLHYETQNWCKELSV